MTATTEYVIRRTLEANYLQRCRIPEDELRHIQRLEAHKEIGMKLRDLKWPPCTIKETWHDGRHEDPRERTPAPFGGLMLEVWFYVEGDWEERFEKP